jgi:thymidylate synthase (FAD)
MDTLPFAEKKKLTSMMRRIIPMGACTGGVWTLNLRALRHVLTLRSEPAAEEEIALVAGLMIALMKKEEPILFKDFVFEEYWKPKWKKV